MSLSVLSRRTVAHSHTLFEQRMPRIFIQVLAVRILTMLFSASSFSRIPRCRGTLSLFFFSALPAKENISLHIVMYVVHA